MGRKTKCYGANHTAVAVRVKMTMLFVTPHAKIVAVNTFTQNTFVIHSSSNVVMTGISSIAITTVMDVMKKEVTVLMTVWLSVLFAGNVKLKEMREDEEDFIGMCEHI